MIKADSDERGGLVMIDWCPRKNDLLVIITFLNQHCKVHHQGKSLPLKQHVSNVSPRMHFFDARCILQHRKTGPSDE